MSPNLFVRAVAVRAVVVRAVAVRVFALSGLCLVGCPSGSTSSAPTAECRRLYDQCRLPDGPLGVCHETECRPGETSPCLTCVSQH